MQVSSRLSGRKHLLSRLPELALEEPGMGIVEMEPFTPRRGEVEISNDRLVARFREGSLSAERAVRVDGAWARYEFKVRNEGVEAVPVRLRVALYLAPGRGGFWGDAEGATYSCRYFAMFGYKGRVDTFSTAFVPEGARGFAFRKHSYASRPFPELKWFAAVDAELREGVGVLCLTPGCYGVVEDQFFNVELNIVKPEALLEPGSEASISFQLCPLHGFARVDHLSPSLAVAVESPSIVKPGEKCKGVIRVFPFEDVEGGCEARVELVRGMASIGKRGYCVDRVPPGLRRVPVALSAPERLTRYQVCEIPFESRDALEWSFERELYEVAYVRARVYGEDVARAFSVNPDFAYVTKALPEGVKRGCARIAEFNEPVESGFMEREAALPLLAALSRAAGVRPGRLLKVELKFDEDLKSLLLSLLNQRRELVEKLALGEVSNRSAGAAPALLIALAYAATGGEEYLSALRNLFEHMVDGVERGTYVDWFNPLQGGGGASRFADYALALDIAGSSLGERLVSDALLALSWIRDELLKLTNAWAGNWEAAEAAALLALSLKLCGDRYETDPAFVKAYATLLASLDSFLPDGAWPELAAGYHFYSLDSLLRMLELLKVSGVADLYKYEGRCGKPVVERALEWAWELSTPTGVLPAFEDSNELQLLVDPYIIAGVRLGGRKLLSIASWLLRRGSPISSPYTILALASSGFKLEDVLAHPPPSPRSRVFVLEDSGRFVYRSSDEPDALYVALDFGPHGGWHGHPDRLSFEVYRRGEAVVVDAGSAGYYGRQHWEWNRRSIAHNTVTLGAQDHPEGTRGALKSLKEENGAVRALFEAPVAERVTLERELVVKGDRVIEVTDRVEGSGVFRWNLHLRGRLVAQHPSTVEVETERNRVIVKLPASVEARIAEGLRGTSEKALYIYYEVEARGGNVLSSQLVFL